MLARQQQDVLRQRCRCSKAKLCFVVVGLLGGHVRAAYTAQNPHRHLRRQQGNMFVLCLREGYEDAPQFLVSVYGILPVFRALSFVVGHERFDGPQPTEM